MKTPLAFGTPGPRAARSVRPAGAERSRGHSPPALGAEAPRPSHAACLGRAPPHIERGRNAATSTPADDAAASTSSAARTAARPPARPKSPARAAPAVLYLRVLCATKWRPGRK